MTIEELKNRVQDRLPDIENRIAWLAERELGGAGRGQDFQARLVREIREHVAGLREALELPPAGAPSFEDIGL